ncbi:hypothetical protein SADO_13008 [Salinisphaera dokdonensis CL-ES53]|uniref:Uncharacterized protein n=1 Tax=Salinisphaera dokdonensis CL-ES53 TaxID=1304272 RepID=A0ABV2B2N9_9GAMM
MLVRNGRLQRLIAVLLVTLVAVSAQAWASHVDWPTNQSGEHAHVDISAFDDSATLTDLESADTAHSDHCCHAAAHLVGLRSHADGVDFRMATPHRAERRNRYTSLAHPPLIDPPIA